MLRAGAPRYEFKISCQPHYLPQVNAWVRLHSAHWRVTYPPRQVNNIYFDSGDYQSLNDNLGGSGTRRKLRLRWYGPILETVAEGHLERKCKEGLVGWKETCPLDGLTLDLAHGSWSGLCRTIQKAADDRANLWMTQFAYPVLINHYQRAYYATPDQTVRLTVDSSLQAYDQRFSARPNLRRPSPIVDRVIVELKAAHQYYPRLANLLAQFPLRTDRFSKYVQGMLAAPDFNRLGML